MAVFRSRPQLKVAHYCDTFPGNSKKNPQIGELAEKVDIAIRQEKKMNEDIHDCKGKITCNIGKIIESIRMDKGI